MKNLFLFSLLLFYSSTFAQKKNNIVFQSGENGYHTFRIPAIIKSKDGSLLAFCEGRKSGSGDFGDIDIVMRISKDNGEHWSSLHIVVDAGILQAGNPAPVIDFLDPRYPNGRIFLFYNTGNNHEGEIRKGHGLREVWYKTSIDGGISWSDAVNITMQVHFPFIKSDEKKIQQREWRSYANTPGHAIQLNKKTYQGRIYIAANHSEGDSKKDFTDYFAHGYYTDDHGFSFHVSSNVSVPGSNESTAAELSDGRLMMNSRNQKGDIRSRIVSISSNGGETWDTSYFDKQLPDPVNEASILSVDLNGNKKILVFSNAANSERRDDLTLKVSYDNGLTWTRSLVIESSKKENSKDKHDYTAYSDLVQLDKSRIGILYERNNYKEIVFKKQKWH